MASKAARARTESEFSRQAEQFASAGALRQGAVLERLAEAAQVQSDHLVLDVACGTGLVTGHLADRARHVVGLDLTAAMLARAQAALATGAPASLARGLAERLPFGERCFDRVVTRLSVHHFENPARVIAEMVRVLAPGGRLVVADLVSSDDEAEAALHNALERLRDPSHVRMHTRTELLALLRGAGLPAELTAEWKQARELEEWLAITGAEERREPVREVMRALARGGERAGIGLTDDEEGIRFEHHWAVVVGERP